MLFHSGEHPTLRLRTAEGYELTGTANHPVLCIVDMAGVPLLMWKLLEEIGPGERVLIHRGTGTSTDDQALDKRSRMLALLAGALVAEGWFGDRRAGFNNVDKDFFDAVLEAYDVVVRWRALYDYSRTIRSGSLCHELDVQNLTALRAEPTGGARGPDERAQARAGVRVVLGPPRSSASSCRRSSRATAHVRCFLAARSRSPTPPAAAIWR